MYHANVFLCTGTESKCTWLEWLHFSHAFRSQVKVKHVLEVLYWWGADEHRKKPWDLTLECVQDEGNTSEGRGYGHSWFFWGQDFNQNIFVFHPGEFSPLFHFQKCSECQLVCASACGVGKCCNNDKFKITLAAFAMRSLRLKKHHG